MKAGMPNSGARVRDVMTEGVLFLHAGQRQEDAWNILHANGISGAPVLGAGGRVAGVVTMTDLADPRHRAPRTSGTVADAMTRVVYAVRPNDPAMAAVRLMIDEDIHRAVVLGDDGKLVGMVVPMDVLRALARGVDVRAPDPQEEPIQYLHLGDEHVRA
ncbi:MAG TPA: CBS domain-containing protein [Polyangiaceae bacterium]